MSKLVEICKRYREIKTAHEGLSDQLKQLGQVWTDTELELIDAMVEEGTNSIDVEGAGKFSLCTKNYLSVNAANKAQFYPYLKESGHGGLLKEDVNPKTLTAFLKTHLVEVEGKFKAEGMDQFDASKAALEFLKSKGAAYFSEKTIMLRSNSNG